MCIKDILDVKNKVPAAEAGILLVHFDPSSELYTNLFEHSNFPKIDQRQETIQFK